MCCNGDIFLALLAVLFPPIAVWIKRGLCSADSLLNILLCMLGYIPGLLHSWYIIAKFPEGTCEHDEIYYHTVPADGGEGGHAGGARVERVTYYYVRSNGGRNNMRGGQQQQRGPGPQAGMSYGTVGTGQQQPAQGPTQMPPQQQGESSQEGVPPSYQEAVQGDHKVQT